MFSCERLCTWELFRAAFTVAVTFAVFEVFLHWLLYSIEKQAKVGAKVDLYIIAFLHVCGE